MKREDQTQPCPGCGEMVPQSLNDNGHPLDGKHYAVRCPHCALPIVRIVPLHILAAPPHGWKWVRADDKSWFGHETPALYPPEENDPHTYEFLVRFSRYHSDDDEIAREQKRSLREQFIAELQEAYDTCGIAGFFDVIEEQDPAPRRERNR